MEIGPDGWAVDIPSPDSEMAGTVKGGVVRMRGLKIATVVMGVMILAGTGIMLTLMIKRSSSVPVVSIPTDLVSALEEPSGSRIVGISVVQDRLALLLQGGGADRVVLVDPRTGKAMGRISLKQ